MARRKRGVPVRQRQIAFDLDKMTQQSRMLILELGMDVIGDLAERVAEQANRNTESIRCRGNTLPGQPLRRGPDKTSGSQTSGPIRDSVFAMPSQKVPTSWLVVAPAWYAHFVEYGTSPHKMPTGSKVGNVMHFAGTNEHSGEHIATDKIINHPGVKKPQPFLRPAADKAEAFLAEIARERGSI